MRARQFVVDREKTGAFVEIRRYVENARLCRYCVGFCPCVSLPPPPISTLLAVFSVKQRKRVLMRGRQPGVGGNGGGRERKGQTRAKKLFLIDYINYGRKKTENEDCCSACGDLHFRVFRVFLALL
jgi:hypothetical protein